MSAPRGDRRRLRSGWLAAVGLAVAAVLVVTLRPDDLAVSTNLKPLEHHGRALRALFGGEGANREVLVRYLATDVLGNLVLFLPVGLAVAGAVGRWPPVARLLVAGAFGVGLSVVIELIQLGVPGRASDVDDVIFNGIGAVVGAAVFAVGARWRGGR
ncbi:MAG: VanZ family protein [Acidobacteriota bacterium]|jgi:VanZ family protein